MATIGLDKLYYAPITEDESGLETYGTPAVLAKAMQADLSVEVAEATLPPAPGAGASPADRGGCGASDLALPAIGIQGRHSGRDVQGCQAAYPE